MKYSGERFLPEECSGEIAAEHYQRYQLASQIVRGKTVLDAACGEGYGSSLLARDADKVFGLDIDDASVRDASAKYGAQNLTFIQGSIANLPFRDSFFDVAVSYETIEHVDAETQRLFLTEIKRTLKPGGILIMSTPNKAVYTDMVSGYNKFHVKEFYVEEYISFLQGYFKHIQTLCQYPDTGYFVAREGDKTMATHPGCSIEHSRYIIAICSDAEEEYSINTEFCTCFDDSMYYSLYSKTHRLENELLDTKREADTFQGQLEKDIAGQKQHINKLENIILEQKEFISHLETDLSAQAEYIHHLECDVSIQKESICNLEIDLQASVSALENIRRENEKGITYIQSLETDRETQKNYVIHLENDIKTLTEYASHLEADIKTLTGYANHLEADIKILNEQLLKTREPKND